MTWSLALALLWVVLMAPVGHVVGRALRRLDDRDAARTPVELPTAAARPVRLGPSSAPLRVGSAPGSDALSRHP